MNKKIVILSIMIISLKSICMEITTENAPAKLDSYISTIAQATKKIQDFLQRELAKKGALEKEIIQAKKDLEAQAKDITNSEQEIKKIKDKIASKPNLIELINRFEWRYDVVRELNYLQKWTTEGNPYQRIKDGVIAKRAEYYDKLQKTIAEQGQDSADAKSLNSLVQSIDKLINTKFSR